MSNTKLWAITILCAAIGWVLYKASPALQPALVAVVIAYLLNPLVGLIERRLKIKKWLAITILLAISIGILILLLNLILPPLANQASQFINEFDSISRNSYRIFGDVLRFLESRGFSQTMITELQGYFGQFVDWLGSSLVHTLTSALGFILGIVDMFLILIMVIYFLASGEKMVQQVVDNTKKPLRQTLLNLITGAHRVIWSYVRTQVIIALIVGVLSTIAFLVIGIKFSVLLGVMAGILNFIPYFGSIIAGTIAALIALLTGGLQQALITLVAVLVVQQIEGNFITPRMQGKSTGLHPVVILIVILTGNYLWGTIGMFIAVPVFGLARLVVSEAVELIKQME
jgi:predicted PurR-regulated permease PerM